MNADDSTHSDGENVSPESYPQLCHGCGHEWRRLGALESELITCPGCGKRTTAPFFFQFWLQEQYPLREQVTVEVPTHLSRAVDQLAELDGYSREDVMKSMMEIEVVFRER